MYTVANFSSGYEYSRPESSDRPRTPDDNPSKVLSLASFNFNNTNNEPVRFSDVIVRDDVKKSPTFKPSKIYTSPEDQRQEIVLDQTRDAIVDQNNFNFFGHDGQYTAANSYLQPGSNMNFVIPHGSLYFDQRLTLDYIDRAVKEAEHHSWDAQFASTEASRSARDAHYDADRSEYAITHR